MIQFVLTTAILLSTLANAASAKEAETPTKTLPPCDGNTKVATPEQKTTLGCRIKIENLHPTQPAVGMLAARCKAQKITAKYKEGKLAKYLGNPDRFVPIVRGPGNIFYLTDHHHLAVGVWNAAIPSEMKVVNAYLIADLSSLDPGQFWSTMKERNNTWLQDPSGKPMTPDQLPVSIAQLADDPLRTLSAWVRSGCGYIKCEAANEQSCSARFPQVACANAFFLEFGWAKYLRSVPEVNRSLTSAIACPQKDVLTSSCLINQRNTLIQVLPAAMKAAAAPEAKTIGGYNTVVQQGQPEPLDCASD